MSAVGEITVKNWGKDKINLRHLELISGVSSYTLEEGRITEVHFKKDASVTETPGCCLVITIPLKGCVYTMVTMDTLNDCLNQFGYQVVKKGSTFKASECKSV